MSPPTTEVPDDMHVNDHRHIMRPFLEAFEGPSQPLECDSDVIPPPTRQGFPGSEVFGPVLNPDGSIRVQVK